MHQGGAGPGPPGLRTEQPNPPERAVPCPPCRRPGSLVGSGRPLPAFWGPWIRRGVTEPGGGRAQTHLFGIRHELNTVGQKLALWSQKAKLGNASPNVCAEPTPLQIPSLPSSSPSPAPSPCWAGARHEETLSLPREGRRRGSAHWGKAGARRSILLQGRPRGPPPTITVLLMS